LWRIPDTKGDEGDEGDGSDVGQKGRRHPQLLTSITFITFITYITPPRRSSASRFNLTPKRCNLIGQACISRT
jgi:hypothetical protein